MIGIWQRLLLACVAILLAVLALQWSVEIIRNIWPVLAIAAGVVLAAVGLITLVRWRLNRW